MVAGKTSRWTALVPLALAGAAIGCSDSEATTGAGGGAGGAGGATGFLFGVGGTGGAGGAGGTGAQGLSGAPDGGNGQAGGAGGAGGAGALLIGSGGETAEIDLELASHLFVHRL